MQNSLAEWLAVCCRLGHAQQAWLKAGLPVMHPVSAPLGFKGAAGV